MYENGIEIYLTHNEEKAFLCERFIKILKYKIYKYMTAVSEKFTYW